MKGALLKSLSRTALKGYSSWNATKGLLLDPLVRDFRLDLDGHALDILFPGGAHGFFHFARNRRGFGGVGFDHDFVVNDIDETGRGVAQLVVKQAERALENIR